MKMTGVSSTRGSVSVSSVIRQVPGARAPGFSIATTHTQARYVLPSILSHFRELHPHLPLHLRQGDSGQIADLMVRGEADIAIASGSHPAFADLLRIPCFRWRRVVVIPENHPLANLNRLTLAQLARYPLITYSFAARRTSTLMEAFHRERLEPEIAVTAWDSGVLKAYIRQGLGVGILADLAIDGEDDADLRVRNVTHLFGPVTTWTGVPRERRAGYGFDLISLLAPHLGADKVHHLGRCGSQAEVDEIIDPHSIPFRR